MVLFYKTISPTVPPASSSSSPTSSAADRASPPRPTNRGRLGGRCKARNRGRNRSHRSRRTWTGGRRSLNWRNTFDFPAKRGGEIILCTVSSLCVGPQAAVLVLTIRTILSKKNPINELRLFPKKIICPPLFRRKLWPLPGTLSSCHPPGTGRIPQGTRSCRQKRRHSLRRCRPRSEACRRRGSSGRRNGRWNGTGGAGKTGNS